MKKKILTVIRGIEIILLALNLLLFELIGKKYLVLCPPKKIIKYVSTRATPALQIRALPIFLLY